ncbi:uncharacterized protein B4U80_12496, partial [Leptotrombidium deliense]
MIGKNHGFSRTADSIKFVNSKKVAPLTLKESKINKTFTFSSELVPDLDTIKNVFDELNGKSRSLGAPQKDSCVDYFQQYFSDLLGIQNVLIQEVGFVTDRQQNMYSGRNIIGRISNLKSTEKESKIVVVGAHYDTYGNSSSVDDNNSGVIGVLELCRIWSFKIRILSDIAVYCVLFDFKEEGLLGSQ